MIFDPAAFEDLLGPEFLERYREKETEYETRVTDRIYCAHNVLRTHGDGTPLNMLDVRDPGELRPERCNAFVGQKTAGATLRLCGTCCGYVCLSCGAALDRDAHQCDVNNTVG